MTENYYNSKPGIKAVNKSLLVPRWTTLSVKRAEDLIKMLAMACSAILIISTLLIIYLGVIHY
jgi:hypothetical protein